ncbi:UNVERIFIED_CONTAM: hypothetical protein Sradi_5313600 [Sesamum radiatum]|uniref:Transposase-associated domain-containing protein n=1 Tax=Sesamum radiatum TaxID=300843 RepID=A0AAW2LN70_SESRA
MSTISTIYGWRNIRCPCCDCKSLKFLPPDRVSYHLISRGFERGYVNWVRQGEPYWGETSTHARYRDEHEPMDFEQIITDEQHDSLRDMVTDVVFFEFNWNTRDESEVPNPTAQKFFKLKDAADSPLWPGCESHSELSALSELLNIKSESNLSERHFNRFLKAFGQMLPKGHKLPDNFYSSKKVIAPLGLGVQKIDACENDCMLYWKEDKKCKNVRYATILGLSLGDVEERKNIRTYLLSNCLICTCTEAPKVIHIKNHCRAHEMA